MNSWVQSLTHIPRIYIDSWFLYHLVKTSSFPHCPYKVIFVIYQVNIYVWVSFRNSIPWSICVFLCQIHTVIYNDIFLFLFVFYLSPEDYLFKFISKTFTVSVKHNYTNYFKWRSLIILSWVIMGLASVDFLSSWELVTFFWLFFYAQYFHCVLGIRHILLWDSGLC